SLTFPFLTQVLIDIGVTDKNLSILYLILLSQLFLFTGNTIIEIIRSWLLLHINARVTLNIISDFLIKLLKLPIKYFDTKAIGDISQRISDHHRIENFL
ncbi:ABC transporter transmembrane domain-containing protein, partial [Streptomyces sp. UMAF16]|nr:ABC transporter transmembrane domain-containing protein [Streptomyces sp. UMAF16]